MAYGNFYELDAWKQARKFKKKVYALLERFPVSERFELTGQLRRSVRSIAANISEGHGRRTPKDELNFCVIARGSLAETLNHLIDAMDSGYLSLDELREFKIDWDELRKVLNGYMSFLQSKMRMKNEAHNLHEEVITYNFQNHEEPLELFFRNL